MFGPVGTEIPPSIDQVEKDILLKEQLGRTNQNDATILYYQPWGQGSFQGGIVRQEESSTAAKSLLVHSRKNKMRRSDS